MSFKKFAPKDSQVRYKSRKHLLPPLLGIGTILILLSFFNSQVIAGKIMHYKYQEVPATLPVSSEAPLIAESSEPRIYIQKLGITAPINFDQQEVNEINFQIALRDGVVRYPNTGYPGKAGNVVIFGHSSNQVWAKGNYKFIFSTLDKLAPGDSIIIDYNSERFVYTVQTLKVVMPTDLSVLDTSEEHKLTLITCTPVGSNAKRLIVEAIQTAPSVNRQNEKTDTKKNTNEELYGKEQLPSNSTPSLWDELKALF